MHTKKGTSKKHETDQSTGGLQQAAQPRQRGGQWHRLATTASPPVADMELHISHVTDSREFFLPKAEATLNHSLLPPPTFTASLSHLHLPSLFSEPTWSKQSMRLSISDNLEDAQSEQGW